MCLFVIFLLLFGCFQSSSQEECFQEGKTCAVNDDNLIDSNGEVFSIDECRLACIDVENCQYITYFGPGSFPFSNYCMLFASCDGTHDCEDCQTETKVCFETCSGALEGQLSDNVVEIMPNVKDEPNCKAICNSVQECKYYTYFSKLHQTFPLLCVLLSELQAPFSPCKEECSSGFGDCQNKFCKFQDINKLNENDHLELLDHAMLENNTSIGVVSFGELECEITMVAVGGGGSGYHNQGGGGGGGSGRIKSLVQQVTNTDQLYFINIGAPGESSSVQLEDELLLSASSGGNARHSDGGSGHSGGGGGGSSSPERCGHGGEDGSNGKDGSLGHGGQGSGVSIASYSMKFFELTAGSQGSCYSGIGGGAGGVLVNGQGPTISFDGEGFGAGGYGYDGRPGVILIEVN